MIKELVAVGLGVYALGLVAVCKYGLFQGNWRQRMKEKFPYPLTVIAHRGGSLVGPENTIYTFSKALTEYGVDMLELDVHLSKDGKIVVSHDRLLGRSCGEAYKDVDIGNINVGARPSDTLPQSARTIPLHFQTETIKDYVATDDIPVDDTTRVCLLSEVFESFPGVPLHVDIKDTGFNFVKMVLDMIESYHREPITFVGSSVSENKAYIKQYFKLCSKEKRRRYRLFGNVSDYFGTTIYFYLGLLPFMNIDFDVFSIPVHTHTMYQDANVSYGKIQTRIGTFFLKSPALWTYLQQRGVAVVAWVMNDETDFAEILGYPINGVMTDDPKSLQKYIHEHPDAVKLNIL